ncbi:MAG: hypothetical protein ABSG40_20530 [Terriglobales bacterium]
MFSDRESGFSDFLLACIMAIMLAISAQKWVQRLFRLVVLSVSYAKVIWDWSARWQWETIFGVGWGVMLGSGEYLLSLIFLGLATFGAIARVQHW